MLTHDPTEAVAQPVERIAFTPGEVARAVGLHVDTILDRIHGKHIPATKLGGRYLITADTVRRLFGKVPTIKA